MKMRKIPRKKTTGALVSYRNYIFLKGNYAFSYEYPSGYRVQLPIIKDVHCDNNFVYFIIKGKYWGCKPVPSLCGKHMILPAKP